jgi:hypothetical protein
LRIVVWVPEDREKFHAVFTYRWHDEESQLYGQNSDEVFGTGETTDEATHELFRASGGMELSPDDADSPFDAPTFTIPRDLAA